MAGLVLAQANAINVIEVGLIPDAKICIYDPRAGRCARDPERNAALASLF